MSSKSSALSKVALVGAGLVGASWAIVFARAGCRVHLYDAEPTAIDRARHSIAEGLAALHRAGLLAEPVSQIEQRVTACLSLATAVDGAEYVQESIAESLELKRQLFARLDVETPREVILASSTSSFTTSALADGLSGRARCLVAHPVNPPHLVPYVEISGAPFTDASVVETTLAWHRQIGQSPVRLHRETLGFVLNRLQWTLLAEAYRLVAEGVVDPEGIDQAIREGLGRRWSFMGPFEVGDLNAPHGLADYFSRFGPTVEAIDASRRQERLRIDTEVVARLDADQRRRWPDADDRRKRMSERDEKLLQLAAWRRQWASSQ